MFCFTYCYSVGWSEVGFVFVFVLVTDVDVSNESLATTA